VELLGLFANGGMPVTPFQTCQCSMSDLYWDGARWRCRRCWLLIEKPKEIKGPQARPYKRPDEPYYRRPRQGMKRTA
jgi:hypothetical protein